MDNKNLKKTDFNLTLTMIIHWYVKTTKQSVHFSDFVSALEFYNRNPEAIIFPIEEVTRK